MTNYKTKTIFSQNLARLLADHKETQADLAKLLGVSKSTVSSWYTGEKMPRMDKIELMADHFGVLKSTLIEGDPKDDRFHEFIHDFAEESRELSTQSQAKLLEMAKYFRFLESSPPK